jgi:hypothetical protein
MVRRSCSASSGVIFRDDGDAHELLPEERHAEDLP